MNELSSYIDAYFGFKDQSADKLAGLFKEETIEKGETHTRIGQYNSNLSFVKKGVLRMYKIHQGKQVTQWISTEGEFVTDLAGIVFGMPARWNIESLTACELYTISSQDYAKIGDIIPEWLAMERLFIAKCFSALEERVFSFLSLSAEERYHQLFEERKALFNQVPLQYLASMIGMTPETFSRIRKKVIS